MEHSDKIRILHDRPRKKNGGRSRDKNGEGARVLGELIGGNDLVTEDCTAQRFAELYAGKLRFCHSTGAWFVWDGSIWRQNKTGVAFQWARKLARMLAQNEDDRVRYVTSRASFAAAVERYARTDEAFAVTHEAWDQDLWLLGTPSGTVDLRTGILRPSDPRDGITRSTSVAPAESADCPLWRKFLAEATRGDRGLEDFLQLWTGYGLTGETKEHALLFVFGEGGNGKGVFLKVFTSIMADYAETAPMETFTASASLADRHPTDLAMLRGARIVTVSEVDKGRAWAETRIKQLTGGDPVTARFMHQNFFTYQPQFKLTIIGNNTPNLRSVDEAARRRFNLAPFVHKPPKPDLDLSLKLREEYPAILRWMIEGCLSWQKNGLTRPESVIAATSEYFRTQDLFKQWLEDECDVEPGNPHKTGTSAEMYGSWHDYAKKFGEDKPGSLKDFAGSMRNEHIESIRTKHFRGYRGVRLNKQPEY